MTIAAAVEAPSPPVEPADPHRLGRLARASAWFERTRPTASPGAPRLVVAGTLGRPTAALSGRLAIPTTVGLDDGEPADGPVSAGHALATRLVAGGDDLLVLAAPALGEPDVLPSTLAAISLVTAVEPVKVVPSATESGPAGWAELVGAVRDRRRRVARDRDAPGQLLIDLDVPDLSACVGLILGAASARVPVMLDGIGALAAGLVAAASTWSMKGWLAIADGSPDPAATAVRDYLRIDPLLANEVDTGDGAAGLLAVQALRDAAALRDEASALRD